MKNIPLSQVKEIICKNIDDINSMDDKSVPAVLVELQAEQAAIEGLTSHSEITEISIEAMDKVFPCWMSAGGLEIVMDEINKLK